MMPMEMSPMEFEINLSPMMNTMDPAMNLTFCKKCDGNFSIRIEERDCDQYEMNISMEDFEKMMGGCEHPRQPTQQDIQKQAHAIAAIALKSVAAKGLKK